MAITELQRTKRQQTLGASDIPTIFGLNPWKSPADLWLEKTGRVEAPDAGEAAEIGDALEAGIKPLAERRLGYKLVKPTGTFIHENGIMSANVDLMAVKAQRGASIVELKTTGRADEWEDGQIPARVMVQVAAQMACAGSYQASIVALLARFGLSVEVRTMQAVDEVRDLIATIEEKAVEWWERHIVADTQPDSLPCSEYLSVRPRVSGKVISIPAQVVAEFNAAKARAKEAEEAAETAKAVLLNALGDADGATTDAGDSIRYSLVEANRLDGKALEAAHPDIAAKFTKPSSYRRLTVKAAKGGK